MAHQVFEGSEKRLEIDFTTGRAAPALGMRFLKREQLDSLLDKVWTICSAQDCPFITSAHLSPF